MCLEFHETSSFLLEFNAEVRNNPKDTPDVAEYLMQCASWTPELAAVSFRLLRFVAISSTSS